MPFYSVIIVPVLFPQNLAARRRKTPGRTDPNRQMPAVGSPSQGISIDSEGRPIEPENIVLLDLIEDSIRARCERTWPSPSASWGAICQASPLIRALDLKRLMTLWRSTWPEEQQQEAKGPAIDWELPVKRRATRLLQHHTSGESLSEHMDRVAW